MLDARARTLYGRQVLLPEIGNEGQAKLLDARVVLEGGPSQGAAVCKDYLQRAGIQVVSQADDAVPVSLPAAPQVEKLSGGDPALCVAAEALVGAFVAVETIKAATGAGRAAPFPSDLSLSPET